MGGVGGVGGVHMVSDNRSQTACQDCGFLASQVLIMIWLRRLRRAPSWCYSPRVQHPMHVGFWGYSGMERPHSLGLWSQSSVSVIMLLVQKLLEWSRRAPGVLLECSCSDCGVVLRCSPLFVVYAGTAKSIVS